MCTYVWMYVWRYDTYNEFFFCRWVRLYLCTYVRMYVCVYVRMYGMYYVAAMYVAYEGYVRIWVCTYVRMYVIRMYVRTSERVVL
jgi:hypothetical protein